MTVANGLKSDAGGAAAMCRRWLANIVAAFWIFVRPARIHPRQPWLLAPRQLAIAVAVTIAAFLLVLIFLDAPAINAVGRLPPWVPYCFDQITDFGKSGWFLWPIGVLFLVIAAMPQNLPRVAQLVLAAVMVRLGFLFIAIGLPGLFVAILKRMIGRARPLVAGIDDPYTYMPFIWRADYASLPSGHATTAFTVLVAFGTLWPRARPILLIYALLIAASRVAVTAHFPTDVLVGCVFGVVGALMVRRYFALRLLGFSVAPDGSVRTFSGPSSKRIKSVARALFAQ
jgi:membrane-associated phospholipid phosphatase